MRLLSYQIRTTAQFGGIRTYFYHDEWNANFDWLFANHYLDDVPPERLHATTKLLYGRNVAQVVGCTCGYQNSNFVIGWWPVNHNGEALGGSRIAVNLAKRLGIKTYNLADSSDFDRVMSKIDAARYHPRYWQTVDGFQLAGSAIDPNSIRRDG